MRNKRNYLSLKWWGLFRCYGYLFYFLAKKKKVFQSFFLKHHVISKRLNIQKITLFDIKFVIKLTLFHLSFNVLAKDFFVWIIHIACLTSWVVKLMSFLLLNDLFHLFFRRSGWCLYVFKFRTEKNCGWKAIVR